MNRFSGTVSIKSFPDFIYTLLEYFAKNIATFLICCSTGIKCRTQSHSATVTKQKPLFKFTNNL